MIVTQIDAFASLASRRFEDSASLFAQVTKPTAMESAIATTEPSWSTESASIATLAQSTVILMSTVDAAPAILVLPSLMESAVTINTAESMDISSTDSATAMKDISGSLDLANLVELTRPTTVSSASALSATSEMSTETASSPTSSPTATTMKDTMPRFKHVSASRELNTSEDLARPSQHALRMLTSMVFSASATLASCFRMENASLSTLLCLHALPTPTSTEFHALATQDTINPPSALADLAQQAPTGTALNAHPLPHVPPVTSSTPSATNASPQLLPAVPTPTSTAQPASARLDST